MKILNLAIVILTFAITSISSAQARDSFNIGINIGGYGYPQAQYYAGPPVVYHHAPPVVYYRSPPAVSFGYKNYGHYNRGYQSFRHDNGWGNGYRWGGRGHYGHPGHRHHHGRR